MFHLKTTQEPTLHCSYFVEYQLGPLAWIGMLSAYLTVAGRVLLPKRNGKTE